MRARFVDEGVFIRSLATRGALGGLSRSTGELVQVLDAMGFDIVIIETVGVGQDEIDIVRTAETTVVVLVPSPASRPVRSAASRSMCTPMFSNGSGSSISLATAMPSRVIAGP